MAYKNVNCPVEEPGIVFGDFSNALRVSVDGSEVVVDFCLYSERDNKARVVSRVRVTQEFLPVIAQKIAECLQDEPPTDGILMMPFVSGDH